MDDVFQGGGSAGASIQVGDVGNKPPHGPGPGGFPSTGGLEDHRETEPEASGNKLGVTPPPWRRRYGRRFWRTWMHTLRGGRIRPRSILKRQ